MSDAAHFLGLYLHLARASEKRRRLLARDRFLILSASVATQMALPRVANYCRRRILAHNPGHMLRRWSTFADALDDLDFLHFLHQVERRYPPEKAENMLAELGIDMAAERATYYDDVEYAASLLDVSREEIDSAEDQ